MTKFNFCKMLGAISAMSAALSAASAAPTELKTKDRGGGLVINIDDRPVLKDMVTKNVWECFHTTDVLKDAPAFEELMASLYKTQYYMATRLRDEAKEVTTCFTEADLVQLPPDEFDSVTRYDYQGLPAGIRVDDIKLGKVIYVTKPIFERMARDVRGLFFVHELIHSFIPWDAPRRDSSVMSVVKMIEKNHAAIDNPDLEKRVKRDHFELQMKMNSVDLYRQLPKLLPFEEILKNQVFSEHQFTQIDFETYLRFVRPDPDVLRNYGDLYQTLPKRYAARLSTLHSESEKWMNEKLLEVSASYGDEALKLFFANFYVGSLSYFGSTNGSYYFNPSPYLNHAIKNGNELAAIEWLNRYPDKILWDAFVHIRGNPNLLPTFQAYVLAKMKTYFKTVLPSMYASSALAERRLDILRDYDSIGVDPNGHYNTVTVTLVWLIKYGHTAVLNEAFRMTKGQRHPYWIYDFQALYKASIEANDDGTLTKIIAENTYGGNDRNLERHAHLDDLYLWGMRESAKVLIRISQGQKANNDINVPIRPGAKKYRQIRFFDYLVQQGDDEMMKLVLEQPNFQIKENMKSLLSKIKNLETRKMLEKRLYEEDLL